MTCSGYRGRLRLLGGLVVFLLALSLAPPSHAGIRVPIPLQAQLVARLGSFDRNFAQRAGGAARVLVVHRAGDSDSRTDGVAFARALGEVGTIGGLRVEITEAELGDPVALAQRVRAEHLALVYFSSGLEGDMPRVAAALAGVDVLTVGIQAAHAEKGAVVGFDLDEARPKIVVNVKVARAQNVAFKAELLKLARLLD